MVTTSLKTYLAATALALLALVTIALPRTLLAEDAAARGVLFYDPTCHNCEVVMNEVLPPLEEQYGDQLQIVRVDASTLQGFDLWSAASKAYEVPNERKGVPLLFIGSTVLSGEDEIVAQLANELAAGMAAGGIPLAPALGLSEADVTMWLDYAESAHSESGPDPVALGLAYAILFILLASLVYAFAQLWRTRPWSVSRLAAAAIGTRSIAIAVLSAIGLGVAAYMSYIRYNSSSALCPIGNCDAVQHSPWAQLLGVPIAYWGLLAYGLFLVLWFVARLTDTSWSRLASVGILALAVFSAGFSVYLTLLEIFVIHAVCMWCLISAAVAAGLLIVASRGLAPSEDVAA